MADSYRVDRLEGGFRVTAGRSAPRERAFSVAVAYDCTRGQPLKKWDPRDFDLSELDKRVEGLRLLRCSGNELVLEHQGPAFRVDVSGFDPNRDLFLRISPAEADVDPAA
jgi:hypothetical protein